MSRRIALALVALTLACKGEPPPSIDSSTLIPADATTFVTIDVPTFRQIEAFDNAELIEKLTSKMPDGADKIAKCGYELDSFRRVSMAEGDRPDADDQVAIVLEGPDFGTESKVNCVAEAFDSSVEFVEIDGRRVGNIEGDGSLTIILLNDDNLLLTSDRWTRPVAALLEGQGESAFAGGFMAETRARFDPQGSAFWYAGKLPAFALFSVFRSNAALDEIQHVFVALRPLDADPGLDLAAMLWKCVETKKGGQHCWRDGAKYEIEVGLLFSSEEAATGLVDEANANWAKIRKNKRGLDMFMRETGLSARALKSMEINHDGSWATVTLEVSDRNLQRLLRRALARPMFGL